LGNPSNAEMLAVDNDPNGLTEIAQQVPTISGLNRVWRALPHAFRTGTGPVARDHLDARMLAKPCRQRFRLPVRQQVHHLIALQIDQNGTVAMATPPRPVINGKHAWCRWSASASRRGSSHR
jgi:hypothetical protein